MRVLPVLKPNCSAMITARDGLLWMGRKMIPLPEADRVARQHGFMYAEQLVKHLNHIQRNHQ